MIRYIFFILLIFSFLTGNSQDNIPNIIIDQFGYLPGSQKIAVIKDPQIGFDNSDSYTPGDVLHVINRSTGDTVFTGAPVPWNNGSTDASSGDKAWQFDFSDLGNTGTYYILDQGTGQRSFDFIISHNVYNEVLKQAMRTFFYQRVGYPKDAQYAGDGWADGASHTGNLQDPECRAFLDKNNPDTEKDLSGGWYDAGDYNKYTNWTANYIVEMMKAYLEKPDAWGDDYNIPESGNGIPDILDEATWGIDHLLKMQQPDGSVLSIVGESHASPPSAATGPSYYGPANTSATMNTAAALAISSRVYRQIGMDEYADTLITRAIKAWNWGDVNPSVLFDNNSSEYNSVGLGAGRQEVDNYGREMIKLEAACYLFEQTGDVLYRDYFDNHYSNCHLMTWNFAYPYETENQEALLYYLTLDDGTSSVQDDIRTTYRNAMVNGSENFPAHTENDDPYLAFLGSYVWGSNAVKSGQGNMFYNMISYGIYPAYDQISEYAAQSYVNYIHGVNPLNFVYLSNMYAFGAENGVNEFYHSWFTNGSSLWDRVGVSTYGPPPGYLTGGPNPSYDWDGCCPSGCGSSSNNAVCLSESISPPKDQPEQKSYKDFNTSWPLNSWSVTENSCGYQVKYIRLLSKFVTAGLDCNGDPGGDAFIDSCGICAGGNTGITPVVDPDVCGIPVDCNGDEYGTAFMDTCGICAGGNTGIVPNISCVEGDTMYIEGRHLYTADGEKVILRGVNEMFVWSQDKDGSEIIPEIAKTGANCARLVWTEEYGNKDVLVQLMENCILNKMIAMPECHSSTGEWSMLDISVNFWKDPVLISGIQANRQWTLLNIGNEIGDGSVKDEQFISGYRDAIDSLRSWGYTVPIVIDAANWGQNADQVIRTWKDIAEHDPLRNILFSVHSYWSTTSNYYKIADESVNNGLPVIVGEGPSPTAYPNCGLLDYGTGLDVMAANEIGWLAWSWGYLSNSHCVPNFDMTRDGIFGNWETDIAENMAVNHEFSLMRTSRRPVGFYDDGLVRVSSVYLTDPGTELFSGDKIILESIVCPSNASNSGVNYEITGDEDVIQFNESTGELEALKPGSAILTIFSVEDPALNFSRPVTVNEIDVTEINIDPEEINLFVGDTAEITVLVLPENATVKDYTFSVTGLDEVIEFEESLKRIIAINPGDAEIKAVWVNGDVEGTANVHVSIADGIHSNKEFYYSLYPNPLNKEQLFIKFGKQTNGKIFFFDITGKEILNLNLDNQSEISIDRTSLPRGIVFIRIRTENNTITDKLVIQ